MRAGFTHHEHSLFEPMKVGLTFQGFGVACFLLAGLLFLAAYLIKRL